MTKTTTVALVALAAGGFWYASTRRRAPAASTKVPYNYEQVSCAEYRGSKLCVFRYPQPYADGIGNFDAYDFNVDGGVPRGGGGMYSNYFQGTPEEAAEDARAFIDAMLGESMPPIEGAQEPARVPGAS